MDKRLDKLKIDKAGKWQIELNEIINEIIIDVPFLIKKIRPEKKSADAYYIIGEFQSEAFSLMKFIPFLLEAENYELCSKIDNLLFRFIDELASCTNFIQLEISSDDLKEILLSQKESIFEGITQAHNENNF